MTSEAKKSTYLFVDTDLGEVSQCLILIKIHLNVEPAFCDLGWIGCRTSPIFFAVASGNNDPAFGQLPRADFVLIDQWARCILLRLLSLIVLVKEQAPMRLVIRWEPPRCFLLHTKAVTIWVVIAASDIVRCLSREVDRSEHPVLNAQLIEHL